MFIDNVSITPLTSGNNFIEIEQSDDYIENADSASPTANLLLVNNGYGEGIYEPGTVVNLSPTTTLLPLGQVFNQWNVRTGSPTFGSWAASPPLHSTIPTPRSPTEPPIMSSHP